MTSSGYAYTNRLETGKQGSFTYTTGGTNTITLGFTPSRVMVMLRPGQSTYFAMTYYNGSSSTGSKFANSTNYTGGGQITPTSTGFTYSMSGLTADGWSGTAYYIAIP